jgi:hypothetical protein
MHEKLSDITLNKELIKTKTFDEFKAIVDGWVGFTLVNKPSLKEIKDIYEGIAGKPVITKNEEDKK